MDVLKLYFFFKKYPFLPMVEEEIKQIVDGDSTVGRDAFSLAWYRAFQRARLGAWVISPFPELMCIIPQ